MRAVIQRVTSAEVMVDGRSVGAIGRGLLVFVGVAETDTARDAAVLADKVVGLRVFQDGEGRMNRSVADVDGEVLLVSQFTLYGDVRRGRRPSFTRAARPEDAEPLIQEMERLIGSAVPVSTGRFGAQMEVRLVNDGPVTLVVDVDDGRLG